MTLDSALPLLARLWYGESFACECRLGIRLREPEAHSFGFLCPWIVREAVLIVKRGSKLAGSCVPGFLGAVCVWGGAVSPGSGPSHGSEQGTEY